MSQYMWTGGYRWADGARMRGDANAVAASLAAVKDAHGRVEVDGIKDAWRNGDDALRQAMGDEQRVMEIGLDHMAYQILGALEYEKVDVRTEEPEAGGRVFQPLAKVTGNPDNVRVFVEMPREAIPLSIPSMRPPATPATPATINTPTMPKTPTPATVKPVEIVEMEYPSKPTKTVTPLVQDRDMEAWLRLCEWRDRYGDIPRYRTIIEAIESLD